MTPHERAEEIVAFAIALLTKDAGIPRADAGRLLLGALARWFGIDFGSAVTHVEELLEND